MANAIIDKFDFWTTAQALKTSNRGRSASNQSLLGIKKLRELILELAISGKLLPQDPKDEPANVLLEKIEKEKKRLVKEGVIKKQDAIPEVGEAEKPYKLPVGWQWIRIRNAGHDWGQKTPASDFTYIDVSAIDSTKGEIQAPTILKASEAPSRARKIVKPGTIIYSTVRPYLKNICVIDKQYSPEPIASTAFAIMHPYMQMPGRFFLFYLQSPVFVRYVESVQNGIAYPAINDKQFFGGLLPLPPLAEQHRIVSKVDELMALCDQLEQQQVSNNEAHQTLVDTLLGTLINAENPTAFEEAWQRIAINFDTILTTEHSFDQLKKAILKMATMGKLSIQSINDLKAEACLKSKFIKGRAKIKLGKGVQVDLDKQFSADEIPYLLPKNWIWIRLGKIVEISGGSQPPKNKFIHVQKVGYTRLIQIRDFKNDDFPTYVPDEFANRPFNNEDIMIGRYGPPVFQILKGKSGTYNVALMKAEPVLDCISKDFLFYLLSEPRIQEKVISESDRTAGQSGVRKELLYMFCVGLPPIAEQQRIVSKINELFVLCDTLKERLRNAQALRNQLAIAVVEQAV